MMTDLPDWQGPMITPSLMDLKMFRDHPHRFLLDLTRKHGEVVWYGVGPLHFVIGTQPKHIQHVLVEGQKVYTKDTFQYRLLTDVTGEGLLTSEGDLWRERRRIQQPAFQRKRLDLVSTATLRATRQMLNRWEEENRREVDAAAEMFRLSLDVVMDVLFGYPLGDRAPEIVKATLGVLDHLIERSRSVPGIPSWFSPASHFRSQRALQDLEDVIASVLAHRRSLKEPRDPSDLLDLLLAAEGEDRITAKGIRDEMMTMIIAGHETVASALTWAWWLIGKSPEVEGALADEARSIPPTAEGLAVLQALPYARNTISEALRLYPPAWVVSRKSEPNGEDPSRWLPEGTLVMLSPYVTQRHPDLWPDPERFDPKRFETMPPAGTYLPFGTGPRLCIGKDFALVEATLVLTEVARRCRLRPTAHTATDHAGVTLQPEGGLPVEIIWHDR